MSTHSIPKESILTQLLVTLKKVGLSLLTPFRWLFNTFKLIFSSSQLKNQKPLDSHSNPIFNDKQDTSSNLSPEKTVNQALILNALKLDTAKVAYQQSHLNRILPQKLKQSRHLVLGMNPSTHRQARLISNKLNKIEAGLKKRCDEVMKLSNLQKNDFYTSLDNDHFIESSLVYMDDLPALLKSIEHFERGDEGYETIFKTSSVKKDIADKEKGRTQKESINSLLGIKSQAASLSAYRIRALKKISANQKAVRTPEYPIPYYEVGASPEQIRLKNVQAEQQYKIIEEDLRRYSHFYQNEQARILKELQNALTPSDIDVAVNAMLALYEQVANYTYNPKAPSPFNLHKKQA